MYKAISIKMALTRLQHICCNLVQAILTPYWPGCNLYVATWSRPYLYHIDQFSTYILQPGPSHIDSILTRLQHMELAAGSPPTLTLIVSLERRWVFILYLPVLSGFPYIANCKCDYQSQGTSQEWLCCGDWWWLISLFSSFTYFGNVLIFNLFHLFLIFRAKDPVKSGWGQWWDIWLLCSREGTLYFQGAAAELLFFWMILARTPIHDIQTEPTNFL